MRHEGEDSIAGGAVCAFFAISGFLVAMSFAQSRSVFRFMWHRFLRIYPGFLACISITALAFAPGLARAQGIPLAELFASPYGPLRYIASNVTLEIHQLEIARLLGDDPLSGVFNGSLWSLIYEWRCYFAMAVAGTFGALGRWRIVALVTFLSLFTLHMTERLVPGTSTRVFPWFQDLAALRPSAYFSAGGCAWAFREWVPHRCWLAALCAGCTLIAAAHGAMHLVGPFTLTYALLWSAFRLPIHRFDRFGDLSYGIYLYAFPIQRMVVFFRIASSSYLLSALVAFVITLLFAKASWEWVEAPALRLKSIGTGGGR